jgi:hypothetical protein
MMAVWCCCCCWCRCCRRGSRSHCRYRHADERQRHHILRRPQCELVKVDTRRIAGHTAGRASGPRSPHRQRGVGTADGPSCSAIERPCTTAGLTSFTNVSRSHRSTSFLAKSGGVGSCGKRPGHTSKISSIVSFTSKDEIDIEVGKSSQSLEAAQVHDGGIQGLAELQRHSVVPVIERRDDVVGR